MPSPTVPARLALFTLRFWPFLLLAPVLLLVAAFLWPAAYFAMPFVVIGFVIWYVTTQRRPKGAA